MKLIDKSALVAEIERLRKNQVFDDRHSQGVLDGLHAIEKFIYALEVKEVDLEKEIQAFALLELEPLKIYDANVGISITMHQLYQCAKHFFELGLKARQGKVIWKRR